LQQRYFRHVSAENIGCVAMHVIVQGVQVTTEVSTSAALPTWRKQSFV